jgi:hypothetical protein
MFGHIKRKSGLGRVVIEGMAPGRQGKGTTKRRWVQDSKETLNISKGGKPVQRPR